MNEKSPNKPFLLLLFLLLLFGDWEEKRRVFCFFVEKEKPKIKKKNQKSLLSFFGLHFLVTRATREEKKAISSCSQTAFLSPGPSVVEEDLEDLEDVHHRGDV